MSYRRLIAPSLRCRDLAIAGRSETTFLCGDALKPKSYERLLGGKRAQMVFTDPPYNVRIAGNVSGLGKARHREFAMASGEMTAREFTNFLRRALTNLAEFSIDGSIHFVCMDWRHIRELTDAADDAYTELKNICVWSKSNAGMGSLIPIGPRIHIRLQERPRQAHQQRRTRALWKEQNQYLGICRHEQFRQRTGTPHLPATPHRSHSPLSATPSSTARSEAALS